MRQVRQNANSTAIAEALETRALLSALTISSDVIGASNIALTAPDTAAVGDDLTVQTGVTINSSLNGVTLNAGDDLVFEGAPSLAAATTITLNVDAGDADAGVGGTATLRGSFSAAGGVFVNGNGDDDTFIVAPSVFLNSTVNIDGAGGTDSLEVDLTGVSAPSLKWTSTTTFVITSSSHQPIIGSNVESIAPKAGTGTFSRVYDFSGSSDGAADTYELSSLAGTVTLTAGVQTFTVGLTTDAASITIIGSSDDDALLIDHSGGTIQATVAFDGGSGNNTLGVIGNNTFSATYSPSATVPGNGGITLDSTAGDISFSNLAPVDISGMITATLNLPSANDVIAVNNGTDFLSGASDAIVVSGSSGGIAIETVAFFNNTNVVLDTSDVDGNDAVNVVSANNMHGNTNVSITTGSGTDTISLAGDVSASGLLTLTGPVSVSSNSVLTATTVAVVGNVDLGSSTLTIDGSSAAPASSIDGIISGAGNLTSNGSGRLNLVQTNTYTGSTTVSNGELFVAGSTATGTAVTVSGTGTLSGSGVAAGNANIGTGGTLTANSSSVGSFTVGNLALATGGDIVFQVNGKTTAGSDYDVLNVVGTVALAGNLVITDTSTDTATIGNIITLINNDGVDAVSGTFAGLAQNDTVSINGQSWRIVYTGGDGNDVVLIFGTPTVSISDTSVVEGNSGTSILVFDVTVDSPLGSTFNVNYASSNITTTNSDYTAVNDTLVFTGMTAGETLTISVVVNSDTTVELDESILLTLTNIIGTSVVTFTDATATGTITNDDTASLSIADVTLVEGNSGTTTFNFVVTLNNDVDTSVTVAYDTADNTATVADSDYTAATAQTLTFVGTAGETLNVSVTVAGDTSPELDETFFVNLTSPSASGRNVTIGTSQGIGTIIDDDRIAVELSTDTATGSEAGTTVVTLTATAATPVVGDQTIDLVVSGTNVAITDYVLSTTTITILDGQTTGTATFTITDDALVELEETATITLSNPGAGIKTGTVASQDIVITDNDTASFSIDDVVVTETNAATFMYTFTVTLNNAVDTGLSVDFVSADLTATATGLDYSSVSGTLSFGGSAGETQTITVFGNGDTVVELDETFAINLSNVVAGGRSVTIADGQGLGTITNDDSATFSIDDVIMVEGNSGTTTLTFTVTLTGDVDTGIVVNYDTADDTATVSNSDYTADSGNTLSFVGTSGETKTISVSVIGDTTVELDETFFVNLSNVSAGGRNVALADAQGVGTITNDDTGELVNLAVSATTGTEAAQTVITLTATAAAPVSGDQTVDVSVSGISVDDYSLSSQTITILDGQTVGTATFTVVNDAVVELLETATVSLVNPSLGLVAGAVTSHTIDITDNDSAVISIDDVSMTETDSGTLTYEFTVTLNAAVDVPVSLSYATANSTATTGGLDYTATSGTLNYAGTAGETQTVSVQVTGDTVVELDEQFFVNLSAISATGRNVTFVDNQGRGTILNNDAATLTIGNVSQAEGNSGTTLFMFDVTLSAAVDVGLSVDYSTLDGTATAASGDYTAIVGNTVAFVGNAAEVQTINVLVSGDVTSELDETLFVTLSNILSAGRNVTLANSVGTGTIQDDDGIAVNLTANLSAGTEAGTTVVTLTVTADTAVTGDQTIDLDISGLRIDANDYSLNTTTITILDGQTTGTATFTIVNDDVSELQETAVVTLTNPSLALSLGSTISQSIVITDDDAATLSIGDASIVEGDSGTTTLTFTVTLTGNVDTSLTVDYATADDSATVAGSDYAAASGTLSFAGTTGETQTISVDITGDEVVELEEAFLVNLLNIQAAGRNVTLSDGQAAGGIINDDSATLSIDNVSIAEGDSGTTLFTFTVTLDRAVDSSVVVNVDTADGTATVADSDYTANTGSTLTFAGTAGETMTFDVVVNGDASIEFNETFLVNLSNLVAGGRSVTLGSTEATGTILDDDGIPVSLAASAAAGTEVGTTQITLTVTAASPVTVDETVDVVISGTGITSGDYSLSTTTVTILAGQTTGTTTFTVTDDEVVEALETAIVTLANPSIGLSFGATISQSIDIASDDSASLSISDAMVTEGDSGIVTATFTVTLDKAVDSTITVDFATADGTATTADSDYASQTGTLTFTGTAGETQTITIDITGDLTIELDELFYVNLSNPAAGGLAVSLADSEGAGTITNDDFPGVVTISSSTNSGTESANTVITLTATVDNPVVGDQTVEVQVSGTNITATDYLLSSTTITILDGQTTGTATFTISSDGLLEGAEIATVTLVNPSAGLQLGTPASTAISITDNTAITIDSVANFPGSQPVLTWQPVQGAVRYEIWFSRVFPQTGRIYSETAIATTSWTPPAQLDPAFYRYWVRAFDADDNASSWSASRSFEVQPTLISPVTPTFSARPTFTWDAIAFAPGYEIFVRTSTGDIRVNNIAGTSWTPDSDLPAGNVRWWIRSSDAQANRGWSDVGVTSTDRRTFVTGPASPTADTTPTITWQAIQGAGRYIVYVQNQADSSLVFRVDNVTTASYTVPTALSAGTYRVWVKAIDGTTDLFSSGVWSNAYDFTITSNDANLKVDGLTPLLSLDVQLASITQAVDAAQADQYETPVSAERQQVELQQVDVAAVQKPALQSAVEEELGLLDLMMCEPSMMATLNGELATA